MNSIKIRSAESSVAIGTGDIEGCTVRQDSMHNQYGRRIERDGTWTVYHVFSGVPAQIGGQSMYGLDKARATETMVWVNASNVERRRIAKRNADDNGRR
jgi:hypothetical protein